MAKNRNKSTVPSKKDVEDALAEANARLAQYKKRLGESSDGENVEKLTLKSETRACKLCNAVISKQNLSRHVNTVHKNLKKFKCKTCIKRFTTKKNLESHELKCGDEDDEDDEDDDEKCAPTLKTPRLSLTPLEQLTVNPNLLKSTDEQKTTAKRHDISMGHLSSRNATSSGEYDRRRPRHSRSHSRSYTRSRTRSRSRFGRHSRHRRSSGHRSRGHHSRRHSRSQSYSVSPSSTKDVPKLQIDEAEVKNVKLLVDETIVHLSSLSRCLAKIGKN